MNGEFHSGLHGILRFPRFLRFSLVLLAAFAFFAPLPLQAATPVESLHALFEREWDRTMQDNPTWASRLGDRRWNDRWENRSPEAFAERHQRDQAVLAELSRIDRAALPAAEQLNLDLFRQQLEERLEAFPHGWHLVPLDQLSGLQTEDELADTLRFETDRDYQDWLARLRTFGTFADQTAALMREGIRRGRTQPRVTMQRVTAQIDAQIVEDPDQSPFFEPFKRIPKDLPAAERERLLAEGRATVRNIVVPAYRRFRKFFTEEYLPACREEPGLWSLPGGDAAYACFARQFTTTRLTPDQIHRLGLEEVARIRGLMEAARKEAKFNGPLAEYFHHLRNDPQYFCSSPLELLASYQVVSKRIDPTLVRVFRTLPRTPYGVEPIPAKIAPDTTTAYYRPPAADGSRAGAYFVNLYRPETRPKWEMMALSLHEAVPGHHFQIALAQETGELPLFRRHATYTAYVEGWALYAESLGYELGLYTSAADKMGQLTYEMWRAVRLVVDTGIHARKWDRDRAISFFRENAPKAENDIVNEIDRYISWPGQALAYKIGELKIRELRSRATRELGPRFDVKEFHDRILLGGALPLDVLEGRINDWIRTARSRGPK